MSRKVTAWIPSAVIATGYLMTANVAHAAPTNYESCIQGCAEAVNYTSGYDRSAFLAQCMSVCEQRWLGGDGNQPPYIPPAPLPGWFKKE
ncbi:hypothetical protein [Sphingomonas phyllosphaerae]|uniref:hypothetical protein n=1 Tax=Sphingomonas phyllosphaerae TaxID=257003 RepID=UPI002FF58765